jgi:hypothetical protein
MLMGDVQEQVSLYYAVCAKILAMCWEYTAVIENLKPAATQYFCHK